MKKFEPVFRIDLEKKAGGGLEAALVNELTSLDAKARELKSAGKNPRKELAREVAELAARVSLGYAQQQEGIQEHLTKLENEYLKTRDRNPTSELARIQRAQLKIDALSLEQADNLAIAFNAGSADLSHEEALRLASRLNKDMIEFVQEGISNRLLDKPWIKADPEAVELHNHSKALGAVPPGNVLIDNTAIHLEHLVDFDGELDRE